MKKLCQRCSASFTCREDRIELCSCYRAALSPQVSNYIQENYSDCLCPKCLNETNTYFFAFDVNPKFIKEKK